MDSKGTARLNVLDLQRDIRYLPKPVIAVVAGYAIGGGHVLHLVCDLTIAADNAIFGQTGPKVGSFDAGYGATYMARVVGHKKAREIWYLCRQYTAQDALQRVSSIRWCLLLSLRRRLFNGPVRLWRRAPPRFASSRPRSPPILTAWPDSNSSPAMLHCSTYLTEEAKEGRDAFLEKRKPDFQKFPRFP